MKQKDKFEQLYTQLQQCKICSQTVSEKVLRKSENINFNSKIMIIAEAMAPNQVRLSWINYFDVNWNIWNTWKMLEKFLNQFWYSVYPSNINCIYNTEIVHCFPWYKTTNWKNSIRRPTKLEISNCVWKGYIFTEIQLLKPKIIFLMWQTSYESFYIHFLNINKKNIINLTQKIELIKFSKKYDTYLWIPVIPIQHASWANPRFFSMAKDDQFIWFIKNLLQKEI